MKKIDKIEPYNRMNATTSYIVDKINEIIDVIEHNHKSMIIKPNQHIEVCEECGKVLGTLEELRSDGINIAKHDLSVANEGTE